MPKVKAVIFDLDGVLISTDHYHYEAWKKVTNNLNIAFDEQVNHRLRGVSRLESLNIILEQEDVQLSESEKQLLAEEKNRYYVQSLQKLNKEIVDQRVIVTLTKLKERGFKLAIGSSSKNAQYILDRLKLTSFFDAISDGNNITQSKPNPEVFLKAAEYIVEDPGNCIVIEDALTGVRAAKSAGMACVAIGHAALTDEADYQIETIDEILDII
ncbi:beta-phosphoglucomutase [Halalkalibacter sp. APA_J-10(15)]|uniref:beta-phosphoglucomutase n=1 Tax=Halalkalibacter sp. APA_J-10(15) TaxID=2933805 RepID=UPI001FF573CD|nr:beta-phosphoglucomutase [Halalkalibacter sp. APA_J-10(15)]MCK0472785.1 beta-phosphoglucomutase [Halalkalibacter sp. APA_J-10(15)]